MSGMFMDGIAGFAVRTARFRGANLPFEIGGSIFSAFMSIFSAAGRAAPSLTFSPGRPGMHVDVNGLRELSRDLDAAHRDMALEMNRELQKLAERGTRYAARSASSFGLPASTVEGYAPRVSRPASRYQWGMIQQTRRKTTGARPDYARLQERVVMDPTWQDLEPDVGPALEDAIDRALRNNGF